MDKLEDKIKVPIDNLKETSWSTIILFSLLYCVYITFINLVLFKSNVLQPISKFTFGLINQTLTVNILSIIIFIFIIIIKFGRLNLHDIGFQKNRLLSAASATFTIWVLMQLINIIVSLIIWGKPIINSEWSRYGTTRMIGSILGQLFGNCIFEELAFRGFLLIQIYKKLNSKRNKLFAGIAVSQVIFALIHIPNRILNGMNGLEIISSLIIVFFLGVLFTAVYLGTNNIFLAAGIHTLWNTPLIIFDGIPSSVIVLASAFLFILYWDKSFGKLDIMYDNSSELGWKA